MPSKVAHTNCGMSLLFLAISISAGAGFAAEAPAQDDGVAALLDLLAGSDEAQFQLDILTGINAAMEGRRRVEAPGGWAAVRGKLLSSPSREVRAEARSLAVVFGDEVALDQMRRTLGDRAADVDDRRHALQSLLAANDAQLPAVLHAMLDDQALREAALQGLGSYDDPATPARILAGYGMYSAAERRAALGTLVGRIDYAKILVKAVRSKKIPTNDLTAATARQLRDLGDAEIDTFVGEIWGTLRTSPREKTQLMDKYKAMLTDALVAQADPSRGRAVFARTCSQCHTLYGIGGKVGPDLTGSNRFNLDYVLQNVIDPSAIIAKDFQVTLVRTKDGRVVSGVAEETDYAVKVVSETGTTIIPRNEIDRLKRSEFSMMPEGLINSLSTTDFTDLVAYLRTSDQVPLPNDLEPNGRLDADGAAPPR